MRQKDEERDNRIINEVIVDAYDEYEQNMGWYYYFEEELSFPISAVVKLKKRAGKTENVSVEVVEITSSEDKGIRLGIVESGSDRLIVIALNEIVSLETGDSNKQVVNDWLYWHNFELLT